MGSRGGNASGANGIPDKTRVAGAAESVFWIG
jgi:hypothetical protein